VQQALVNRIQRTWAALAQVPIDAFLPSAIRVEVSPHSRICPTGWVGVVAVDGSILATAPSAREAELVGDALSSLAHAETVSEMLAQRLTAAEVLGPASLYDLPVVSRLVYATDRVEAVPVDSADLARLLGSVDDQEASESAWHRSHPKRSSHGPTVSSSPQPATGAGLAASRTCAC
jgi:hypothetical protein